MTYMKASVIKGTRLSILVPFSNIFCLASLAAPQGLILCSLLSNLN